MANTPIVHYAQLVTPDGSTLPRRFAVQQWPAGNKGYAAPKIYKQKVYAAKEEGGAPGFDSNEALTLDDLQWVTSNAKLMTAFEAATAQWKATGGKQTAKGAASAPAVAAVSGELAEIRNMMATLAGTVQALAQQVQQPAKRGKKNQPLETA